MFISNKLGVIFLILNSICYLLNDTLSGYSTMSDAGTYSFFVKENNVAVDRITMILYYLKIVVHLGDFFSSILNIFNMRLLILESGLAP